jgi:hypothetical protein
LFVTSLLVLPSTLPLALYLVLQFSTVEYRQCQAPHSLVTGNADFFKFMIKSCSVSDPAFKYICKHALKNSYLCHQKFHNLLNLINSYTPLHSRIEELLELGLEEDVCETLANAMALDKGLLHI